MWRTACFDAAPSLRLIGRKPKGDVPETRNDCVAGGQGSIEMKVLVRPKPAINDHSGTNTPYSGFRALSTPDRRP